jgi:plastocyanin
MHRRDLASLAALSFVALTIGVGCPEDQPAGTTGGAKPTTKATGAATTKATGTAAATKPTAAPTGTAAAAPAGNGTIKGVVSLAGKAPEMKVPTKRKDAEFCKGKEVKYNAVLAEGGKLQDVFVRLEKGAVKGKFDTTKPAVVDQVDCMYSPRIQGVLEGQEVQIKNSDGTLHNVHTYKGTESWFNQAQPKGAEPITKEMDADGVVKFTCDVHPWMRGFVVVMDHPYYAVSGKDGSYTIEKIPAGKYKVEAWHSQYGLLSKADVEVTDAKPAEVAFEYKGTEPEPDFNKDEFKGLW